MGSRRLCLIGRFRPRRGQRSRGTRSHVGNRYLLGHRPPRSALRSEQTPILEGQTDSGSPRRKVGPKGVREKAVGGGYGCRFDGGTKDRLHR